MKRGLFLLATMTLTSALYAQGVLSAEKARQIVGNFNPQLLERAAQSPAVSQLVDELISSYLSKQPADDLAGRYELAALARNFDNSIALYEVTQGYEQAVRYSYAGQDVEPSARQYAQEQLRGILARIWAVSVQTKTELLAQYKKLHAPANGPVISALETELKNLQTEVGDHLAELVQVTLNQAQAQVQAEQTALRETTNLQVKTKHKKPVAE